MAGEALELFGMNGHCLPLSYDSATLYITQCDMCKLLEYGKVDAWVFLKTCLGSFLFSLGLIEMSVLEVF